MIRNLIHYIFILSVTSCSLAQVNFPVPRIPFSPKSYVCYRTSESISVDGHLTEADWLKSEWTEYFGDIEGHLKSMPRYKTRVKMLWDDTYFYFAGEMEDPHVWATLSRRDTIIFYDNDFEIFIDPNGDTHEYYELEMNAFNTIWDLLLTRPYRDDNSAVNAWNYAGMQSAVQIKGTINRSDDTDIGWQVEVALPWRALRECAHRPAPPENGDQWRVNFSRVEWRTEIVNGKYIKTTDPQTGKPYPEDNWTWSPQGLIQMHYPEMWGYVQFSEKRVGESKDEFQNQSEEAVKWVLRQVYYYCKNYQMENGEYPDDINEVLEVLKNLPGYTGAPGYQTTDNLFEASLSMNDGKSSWHIRQDGLVWKKGK